MKTYISYWLQAYDPDNVCIFFYWIDHFMLKGKAWQTFANLFSPSDFKKNDEVIWN